MLLAATASADQRAPFATREAVVGCWDVKGATLTVKPFGKQIRYLAKFATRPKGGPSTMSGDGVWVDNEFDVVCRPRSQHGSFCRISPTKDGLRVRVFAIRYDDRHTGLLVEDFVAHRCAK
jgi:hypothetical protein